MKKIHKTIVGLSGPDGDSDVCTACGLNEYMNRYVDWNGTTDNDEVTCKNCLRAIRVKKKSAAKKVRKIT